ncbi:hypothetical protein LJK88_32445 [Paenibacillus sp. P26]|nr:hypothetical protein LJK88_32445 [Paenibacillus sp. P26]
MKFEEYVYVRPDLEQFRHEFTALLERFGGADTFEEQDAAMEAIAAARTEISSMLAIARIRHSINTADPYYKAEQDYIDEYSPSIRDSLRIITRR